MKHKYSLFLLIIMLSIVIVFCSCQQRLPADESTTIPVEMTLETTSTIATFPVTTETTVPTTATVPAMTKPTETNPTVTVPPVTVPSPTGTTPLHKHSYSSKVVSPGCQTEGYTIFTCFCGDVHQSDTVTALGHKWGEWTTTKEASATEEGHQTRTCSVCKDSESRVIEKLPTETTHTHSYTANAVPATCVADGYTAHSCSCGDSYTDSPTKATGHSWGQWLIVKDATTTEEGQNMRICTSCEATEIKTTPVFPDDSQPKELFDPATDLEAEIARLFFEYINQYRKEDGSTQLTYLPGMSQVAQYRSRQLVTNLAHDTTDRREALAYYKYGKWIDPSAYGDPDAEGYFSSSTSEAIGKTNLNGTAEEVACELANACRNSASHWRYVGSSDYGYSGVGVAYAGGEFYVCIMVGRTNYG